MKGDKPLLLEIEVRQNDLDNFDLDIGAVGCQLNYAELVDLRNKLSQMIEKASYQRIQIIKNGGM